MQELERQTWADLNLLRNPASKRDTFLRQRRYLERKLNREPNLDERKRQQVLKMFHLDDARRPPDVSEADTFVGFVDRALSTGVEQAKTIYHGMRGRYATATDDADLLVESRRGVQKASQEIGKIAQVQEPYTDNAIEQFGFDAVSSLPVMGSALLLSAGAAKGLTTVGIPTLFAGIIGYGFTDALLEGGGTFADVITHPDMMAELKKVLGHEPTQKDLRDISGGVGKILSDRASDAADRTAITNLFNPLNIVESRLGLLGGGGLLKRMAKRGILVEGPEETAQSIVSQSAREAAIREIDPVNQPTSGIEGLYKGFKEGDIDFGQALYEGALGAVTGPVVAGPQIYRGIQQEKRAEEAKQALEEAQLAEEQDAAIKREMSDLTLDYLVDGDFESIDRMYTSESTTDSQKETILGVIKEAKRSENNTVATNAKKYRPGENIPEDSRTESMRQKNRPMPSSIKSWEFAETYSLALEAVQSEENGIGKATDMEKHMVKYATMVDNPTLKGFKKSWASVKSIIQEKAPTPKEAAPQPASTVDLKPSTRPSLQAQIEALKQRAIAEGDTQTAQFLQDSQDGESFINEEGLSTPVTQPQAQAQPQVQPQQPVSAPAQPTTTASPTGNLTQKDANKILKQVFKSVLGEDAFTDKPENKRGTKLKKKTDETGKEITTEEDQFLSNRVNQALNKYPKSTTTIPGVGQGTRNKGEPITIKTYNQAQIEFAAKNAISSLLADGHITPEQSTNLLNAIVPGFLGQQQTQPAKSVEEASLDVPEAQQQINEEGRPSEEITVSREGAIQLFEQMGYDSDSAEAMVNRFPEGQDEFTLAELKEFISTQGASAEAEGGPMSKENALRTLRSFFKGSDGAKGQQLRDRIRAMVVEHIKQDSESVKPTFEKSAVKNNQIIDAQYSIATNKIIPEYLEAVESMEGFEQGAYPTDLFEANKIINVLNPIYDTNSGGSRGAAPAGLTDADWKAKKDSRMKAMIGRLKDKKFKGGDHISRERVQDLKIEVAMDDKSMAFVTTDGRTILKGSNIPEGSMIQRLFNTKTGPQQRLYAWTGLNPNVKDRKPGYWVLVQPGLYGGYTPVPDYRAWSEGETFYNKDKGMWSMNPDNAAEVRTLDESIGKELTAAWFMLKDGRNEVGGSNGKFSLAGSGRIEPPEFRGKTDNLTPEQRAQRKRAVEHNKTFDRGQQAIQAFDSDPKDMNALTSTEVNNIGLDEQMNMIFRTNEMQTVGKDEDGKKVVEGMHGKWTQNDDGDVFFRVTVEPDVANLPVVMENEMGSRLKKTIAEEVTTKDKKTGKETTRVASPSTEISVADAKKMYPKQAERDPEAFKVGAQIDILLTDTKGEKITKSDKIMTDLGFKQGKITTDPNTFNTITDWYAPTQRVKLPKFKSQPPQAVERTDSRMMPGGGRWTKRGVWRQFGADPTKADRLVRPDEAEGVTGTFSKESKYDGENIPDEYKSLIVNKPVSADEQKKTREEQAVEEMPEWLTEMIKKNPVGALYSKDEMREKITFDHEDNPLALPKELMPKKGDSKRVAAAKEKVIDSLWEASVGEFYTKWGEDPKRYSALPKLWMALETLKNPKIASAAMRKFINFKSAARNKGMTPEQMENELIEIENLRANLGAVRLSYDEAVTDFMNAEEDWKAIEVTAQTKLDQLMQESQKIREDFAKGKIDQDAAQDRIQKNATDFLTAWNSVSGNLEQTGRDKFTAARKAKMEGLGNEITRLTTYYDELSIMYEKAMEDATRGAMKWNDKSESLATKEAMAIARWGELKHADATDKKYYFGATYNDLLNKITSDINQKLRDQFKLDKKTASGATPKPAEIDNMVFDYIQERGDLLLGMNYKHDARPLYIKNVFGSDQKTLQAWPALLSQQWIDSNYQTQAKAGQRKGKAQDLDKPLETADVLGPAYKKPIEEVGKEEFLAANLDVTKLRGAYQGRGNKKLTETQFNKFVKQMSDTKSENPLVDIWYEGFNIDAISDVEGTKLQWHNPDIKKADRSKTAQKQNIFTNDQIDNLIDNHVLLLLRDMLVAKQSKDNPNGIGMTPSKAAMVASEMYNQLRDLGYRHLYGLASYGIPKNAAGRSLTNAAQKRGLIDMAGMKAIDKLAVQAEEEIEGAGKKKL